jgi:hypothetical protein
LENVLGFTSARGYLRGLRDRQRRRKRGRPGRPKGKSRYRPITDFRPITDYRIDACFQPIELVPAAPAGIIMSAQSKSLPIVVGNSDACESKIGADNNTTSYPMTHRPDELNPGSREGSPLTELINATISTDGLN